MTTRRSLSSTAPALLLALVLGVVVAAPTPAGAHTDADLVAVPAGAEATLNLKPTHGCDGSPTVEVAIRAPFPEAVAGEVEGWTASTTAGDDGNTVLEWTGGTLPADQEGAFPVTFTVPDTVGELLVFPSIQICENGEELAWIDGDPASEYPAPRLLVLPADAEPAASIDDVAPDAPGRDQLVAIVDVDNPDDATTTDDTDPSTTSDPAAPSTSQDASITSVPTDDATTSTTVLPDFDADEADDDDSSAAPLIIAGVIVVLALAGVGYYLSTRRSAD